MNTEIAEAVKHRAYREKPAEIYEKAQYLKLCKNILGSKNNKNIKKSIDALKKNNFVFSADLKIVRYKDESWNKRQIEVFELVNNI